MNHRAPEVVALSGDINQVADHSRGADLLAALGGGGAVRLILAATCRPGRTREAAPIVSPLRRAPKSIVHFELGHLFIIGFNRAAGWNS